MSRDPFIDLADEALAAAALLDRTADALIGMYWNRIGAAAPYDNAAMAFDVRASAIRLRNLAADVRTIRYTERRGG